MTTRVRELEARLIQALSAVECLGVLLELAELHASMHRNREGLRCAREALNIARARNDTLSAARALCTAARCHYQRSDHVSAAAAGFDAIEAFGDADPAGRSQALCNVARALLAVEAVDLAEVMAERATADAITAGDAGAEACGRAVWGQVLAQREQFRAARRKFREAGAIQRRLGDKVKLKKCAMNVGHGYRDQGTEAMRAGEMEKARMFWRHALRVYRVALASGSSPNEDALMLAAIAECECHLENAHGALEEIHQALELASQSANPAVLAHCHLWESHALKALGKLESSRRAIECARNAAEQLDHDPILAECLLAESTLNDLAGRFESAQDLESRAEQVMLERSAAFARIRDELGLLVARHTVGAPVSQKAPDISQAAEKRLLESRA